MEVIIVIAKILIVLVVSFFITLGAVQTARLLGIDVKDFKQRTAIPFLSLAVFFNLLFIGFVALILYFIDGKNFGVLGFGFTGRGILFSSIALFVTLLTAIGFMFIMKNLNYNDFEFRKGSGENDNSIIKTLFAFFVLIIAALQEEILFRGYLSVLLIRYGFFFALLVSTIIFTAWHFMTSKVNVFQVIDWFIGGALLFYIYHGTGSVWVATAVHFSRNFTNVVIFDIAGTSSLLKLKSPVKPHFKSMYTIVTSLLIFLAYLFMF